MNNPPTPPGSDELLRILSDIMTFAQHDDDCSINWMNPEPCKCGYTKASNAALAALESRTPVQSGESDIIYEAQFLLDRLNELDCSLSTKDFFNEWCGHVIPPMARLQTALYAHIPTTNKPISTTPSQLATDDHVNDTDVIEIKPDSVKGDV